MTDEMMDRIDALVAEKVCEWKWVRAVECDYLTKDMWGKDSLLAHMLRSDTAWMQNPATAPSDMIVVDVVNRKRITDPDFKQMPGVDYRWGRPKRYTRDPVAMMEVIEMMRERKRRVLTITSGTRTICEINVPNDEREYTACSESMPLAVALAALKSVGVDVLEFEEANP